MTPPIKPGFGLSDKIQWSHLDRLAVVYVRQSTLQQVTDHQESTRLQYGLVTRADTLGWPSERILTIDEDLACIIHDACQWALTWPQRSQRQQTLNINVPVPTTA